MSGVIYEKIRPLKNEPCQMSHFSMLGDEAEFTFNNLGVSNMLCIAAD